ncbi:MAG: energy-coupling factor ABC transporter ATP-binding protein [Archaeoglobaceae archaeon]|nr:energy-coupling factor ABC transporter ATP-binding protein [Archaeoglobaceae archaeon]MCX8152576.1 energy-coupling factor ABC transporter ATP-binding protein [Archaeoglobaceae archaeon]MDW8014142.1 ABC transporter ATP-binding protein [Archaeoglobaceae archaeon]
MVDLIVEMQNVSFIYPDGTVGVKNVTLNVLEKDKIALIGPSGSGKTTLIFLMAALIKPTSGNLKVFGIDVNNNKNFSKNIEKIRRKIGVVFQNPDDFLFNPTVRDELLYVPLQLNWKDDLVKSRFERVVKDFGVENILDKPPFRLSMGEKKKIAIASVMIYEPEFLLLDEPTANVDGKIRRFVLDLLKRDKTIVVATHDVELVKKFAEKVIVLEKGEVVSIGGLELVEDLELLERIGII